jgi:hypothetical protein
MVEPRARLRRVTRLCPSRDGRAALAPRGPGKVRGRHRAERVKFATRPNRDPPRRPTSPADEHAKRAWAMLTPLSILHRKSFPLTVGSKGIEPCLGGR